MKSEHHSKVGRWRNPWLPTASNSNRRRRGLGRTRHWLMLMWCLPGCLYDADERCDPGQELFNDERCVCAEGSVLVGTRCVACGENEVAGAGECVCAEGYTRPAAGQACQATALGADCSEQAPCSQAPFDQCVAAESGPGYCSRACASTEDCTGGYQCDVESDSPLCLRPPSGTGAVCATSEDCAGFEASFCEDFMLHQCVVSECTPGGEDCFLGTTCCDFTAFGAPTTFCLPEGSC